LGCLLFNYLHPMDENLSLGPQSCGARAFSQLMVGLSVIRKSLLTKNPCQFNSHTPTFRDFSFPIRCHL